MSSYFNSTSLYKNLTSKWKQGDEEDTWKIKAVEVAVKKLRKQPGEVDKLNEALTHKKSDTECVLLPRSQDGRIQVLHKKMLPQVMYCRVWRWPDLINQNELKSVPNCQYPPQQRDNTRVCINPYHYIRVEHQLYPSVVVPERMSDQQSLNGSNSPYQYDNDFRTQSLAVLDPSMNNGSSSPYAESYYSAHNNMSPCSYPGSVSSLGPNNNMDANSHSPPPRCSENNSIQMMDCDMQQNQVAITTNIAPAPEPWCQIIYYELCSKVGNAFLGREPKIIVDGFTNCSYSNRFSLGALSNIRRNGQIEATRRGIQKGILLEDNGSQVYVRNLSSGSIFFQSKTHNVENGLNNHTVIKLLPDQNHKIFDYNVFENILQDILNSNSDTTYDQVYSLHEHCVIRISFLKGWGSIYMRQDVTSTPCWIEIQLRRPSTLLDQSLQHLGTSNLGITSTS